MDKINGHRKSHRQAAGGQTLVEYALILVLIGLALIAVLQMTGPVIGNLFGETVYRMRGTETIDPADLDEPMRSNFYATQTAAALHPLEFPPPLDIPEETTDPDYEPPEVTSEATPEVTSEVTPEVTPDVVPTAAPTPIPDFVFTAPHWENVNEPQHWRVMEEPWLGPADWVGAYFAGAQLDGAAAVTMTNTAMYGAAAALVLNFPNTDYSTWKGTTSGPIVDWPSGSPYDNFSVRFTRQITVDEDTILRFTARFNDGLRLWLLRPGQTAADCSTTGISSGETTTNNTTYGDPSTDCLLIDAWVAQDSTRSVVRTIPAGDYILQVDYFEVGGDAKLALNISLVSNVDDTAVDAAGNPTSGTVNCGWSQHSFLDDANSLQYDWVSYPGNAIPRFMRCYLEFRGYIIIDNATVNHPELVFWDLWDFQSDQTLGWLEVAEYIPTAPGVDVLNRDAVEWFRIDLHRGADYNYNWTRHSIDLTNCCGMSFVGRNLTFRFVIENRDTAAVRRWYIDDIDVLQRNTRTFPTPPSSGAAWERTWDLNSANPEGDFIASGQWELNNNNANLDVCCSWELQNDYGRYARHSESPSTLDLANTDTLRVHYLELDYTIDASASTLAATTDSEGDTGAPMLSFLHGYKIGRYTGLEVQYYNDAVQQWLPVPGRPSQPAVGILLPITYDGSTYLDAQDLMAVDIPLEYIPQPTYRLRFAMLVHNRATLRGGWWIDNIRLQRSGRQNYLDYPFLDGAESGIANWLPGGAWGRTNTVARDGAHSFTDTPSGSYSSNSNASLRTAYPIDLNNDSPENLSSTAHNPSGGNSGGVANRPILTFYHRRDIRTNDAIYVEWRRLNEPDTQWKPLWAYVYNARTGLQYAWEFVRIDLSSITFNPTDADRYEDDILIRFRLQSDGFSEGDGVYIDNIRLENYAESVFKLWPTSENRTVGGVSYGTGNGASYTANLEEGNWALRWRADGTWQAITWAQREGLRSWHESAVGQTAAPVYQSAGWRDATMTPNDSFNVLELAYIIDLRAAYTTARPTLYFWTRYHIGRNERIMVQISQEMPTSDADMTARCGGITIPQCYEQIRGWSEWQTTSFNINTNWSSTYSWQLAQVDLSPYASNGATAGRRIRVRFVIDSLDNSNTSNSRDGWYIDNVSIGPRYDLNVLQNVSTAPFEDNAQNTNNWIPEGIWGLSPDRYRSGGGAGLQGTWHESFWDCRQCPAIGQDEGAVWADEMRVGADIFLDLNGQAKSYKSKYKNITPVTRDVTSINYDIGLNGPYSGFSQTNEFAGRWVLNTTQIGSSGGISAGIYSITTVSDDGVRVKVEELDGYNGTPVEATPVNDALEWNIIYNWNDHGRTTDMGVITLEDGLFYRITIEWYDRADSAALIVNTGSVNFSFTDSPKQGAGTSFPDIPTIADSNSSLILNGSLNLTGTTNPGLQYYTMYEIRGTAHVEISADGGFTWAELASWGNTTHMDDWELRQHSLDAYVGQTVMLRFRMDNDNLEVMDLTTDYSNYVSWWLTDIRVVNNSGITP